MAQSKVAQVLTRKVGPAPLWAWVIAAVVGYVIYRNYSGGPSTPTDTTNALGAPRAGATGGLPANGDTGSAGGSGGGGIADNMSADLLSALGSQGFGTKDSYNTYAPSNVTQYGDYTFSPTTTTDYGTGNTFPPTGGTAAGNGTPVGVNGGVNVHDLFSGLPAPSPVPTPGPGVSGSAAAPSVAPRFQAGFANPPGFAFTTPGGRLEGHGAVVE